MLNPSMIPVQTHPTPHSITAAQAIHAAREWIAENKSTIPGYTGAYIGGSTAQLRLEEAVGNGSDTDVYIVTTHCPPQKPGKLVYHGVLLEISYIEWQDIFPVKKALCNYYLAYSLRCCRTIEDDTGALTRLQKEVADLFSRPEYLRARRNHALERVRSGLENLRWDQPLPDIVLGWLFPMGITTHAVLTAAQKNPTVRLRYLRAKEVLVDYGMENEYERLLTFPGFSGISSTQAYHLLDQLEPMYDLAADVGRTHFVYSSDISPQSRFTAIDVSSQLIGQGAHREIAFWILATYARVMKILLTDAPSEYQRYLPYFEQALSTVHRLQPDCLRQAVTDTLDYLPQLTRLTDRLMKASLHF